MSEKIVNIAEAKLTLAASASLQTVFTGPGIILRVVVDKGVDGSELELFDNDDGTLDLKPDTDVKGTLNYGYEVRNGCKATASDFTGGRLHIFYKAWTPPYQP